MGSKFAMEISLPPRHTSYSVIASLSTPLIRGSQIPRFPSNRVGARVRDLRGSNDVSVGFAPLIGPGNSVRSSLQRVLSSEAPHAEVAVLYTAKLTVMSTTYSFGPTMGVVAQLPGFFSA
jgi:hypothetical protein